MTFKTIASTATVLAVGANMAAAGGLDRVTFSSDILYEEGTYAEIAYGQTNPAVDSPALNAIFGTGGVAGSFNTVKLGFKTDLTDKIAIAFTYNNQPIGADIAYAAPIGIVGTVNGHAYTLLGKYQFNDRISAFGGVKYQYLNGAVVIPAAAYNLTADGEGEFGYIAGAAYEIPDIKLRVALSYESEIDYELPSTVVGLGTGTTTFTAPEAWTLEFRTGVAPKTLVFGSIRYATWKDSQIVVPALGQITSFTNVTSYKLGVAHRLTDAVVGFLSFGYEKADEIPQSAFAPTDGQFDISVGGQFDVGQGYKITSGVTYSRRGDAVLSGPGALTGAPFDDNRVMTFGIKVSKSFGKKKKGIKVVR